MPVSQLWNGPCIMDSALLVSGIALVKRELDQLDAKIRETQIQCSSTSKAISQSRQDSALLDTQIEEAQQHLAAVQGDQRDVQAALAYRRQLWRVATREEMRLRAGLGQQRAVLRAQLQALEDQAKQLRVEMSEEVADEA